MLDAIFQRRSIRKFLDKPVSQDLVTEIIRAGMYAPSAKNKRSWSFIVCDIEESLSKIQQVHQWTKMLDTAPICIVVCGDTEQESYPGSYVADCSLATENIMIAAKSLGLDTCWISFYPYKEWENSFSDLFQLPDHIKPFCGIALGYGNEHHQQPDRFEVEKIHFNKW